MFRSKIRILMIVAALAGAVILGADAMAASDLGQTANKLSGQISSVRELILGAFTVGGIVMLGMGIFALAKNRQNGGEGGMLRPISYMAAGILLLAIPALSLMGIATFGFDEGKTAGNLIEYNQ